MAGILEKRYIEVKAGRGSVQELLAGLKSMQTGLKNRLKSSVRMILPGANRESSAWRALSSEYGPNEPITQAVDWDMDSVRLQHYVDHYRTVQRF